MDRLLLIITVLLTCYGQANAQHDYVWAFGGGAGIDFNKQPPESLATLISTEEGTASICDENGRLLFYTDGNTIYNRAHAPMIPGGNNIAGGNTASTSQGAIIVPLLGDSAKYYVFSLLSYWNTEYRYPGRLMYSIVDMAAENGWGAVTTKGNIVAEHMAEYMTAVSGNDCNVWLITVSLQDNSFRVFNLDINGLDPTPVVSPAYITKNLVGYYELAGTIDVSPDRKKLVVPQERLLLYDFDVDNGRVSNAIVLDSVLAPDSLTSRRDSLFSIFYGAVFSPDNSKLYTSSQSSSTLSWPIDPDDVGVFQFDLRSGDPDTMAASRIKLSSSGRVFAMQRAPDGKIYGARHSNKLAVIHQPNLAGTACQFEEEGFQLQSGASVWGMPNTGTIYTHRRFFSSTLDSSYCSNPRTLTARHTEGWEYTWNDGFSGTTRTVETPGTYWVKYKVPINSPCKYDIHVDTFRVAFALTSQYLSTVTRDSGICKADRVKLEVSNPNGSGYLWENGDEGREREATFPGVFWVSYAVDSLCEFYRDSFLITYDDYEMAFEADSFACADYPIVFNNTSDRHYHAFNWSFGDGANSTLRQPEHTYTAEGRYRVTLSGEINAFCRDTAYHIVTVDSGIPAYFELQPHEICVGDKISVRHSMRDSSILELYWQMGDGSSSYVFDEWQQHAYDRDGVMYLTLDASFRACPPQTYKDSVIVYPLPVVDLGSDLALCLNGTPILLYNKRALPTSDYAYLWNTGDTTAQLKVTHPGVYTMRVSSRPLGCSTSESVEVKKDCYIDIPNAFTPNGDGENDYFFPRQLLSKGLSRFSMKVFNRWGQVVFETDSVEGRGWDGRFNGKEQPVGVYVYRIEVEGDGERNEKYEGNVTLLR